MPRRAKGLTAAFVEKATKPGRYGDGDGLYLLVRSSTAKFWESRFTPRGGKRREMGLGAATGRNRTSLSQARVHARAVQAMVREGRDPLAERAAEKAKTNADASKAAAAALTFAAVTDLFLAAHQAAWSQRHRAQWHTSLEHYALPVLGSMPVAAVDTADVMRILEPLWREKTETMSRLRARIEAVLDYAKARGWRDGENPARWRGHIANLLPARGKVRRVVHHAALNWRETGGFMQRLRQNSSINARCLEFLILTATRSGEARGARWSEIDLAHKVWTIPAERMKAARAHRVPLSDPALTLLRTMLQFGDDGLIFPGLKPQSALSDVALTRAVRTANAAATVHGFRSTFRDWVAESTNHPRELAEMALAHALRDKIEAAYQRGDLLERRRTLMDQWAAFCAKPTIAGDVVPLRAAT
jgi:integrase